MLKKLLTTFCLLLLIITIASGDDPDRLIAFPQGKLFGFRGMDSQSTPPTVADGRASSLLNVKLSPAFDLTKRNGYTTINSTLDDLDLSDPPIVGLFDSEYSSGTSWIYAFIGYKIKYNNAGIWTVVPPTASGSPTITAGQNNIWKCIMALDNAVCTDNVDAPIAISSAPNATALSFSGLSNSVTKVKSFIWFRNYLVAVNTTEGGTSHPTRFRWSNVGTINAWDDDDFNDISELGGDEIVGINELYGDLYIFLKHSIWKASLVGGDDVFIFSKQIDGVGAIARDTIQNVQLPDNRSAIIFVDDRRRILLTDGVSILDIGAIIQPTLNGLSESRLPYAASTFDGKSYFLSVSSSGVSTNDQVFEFQTQIQEWTRHDQIDANVFAQIKDSDDKRKTYFGNYKSIVYWLDDPDNDNDVAGANGIVDSAALVNTTTDTGAMVLLDATLPVDSYTGAIVKITSGTAAGEEAIVATNLTGNTGIILASAIVPTPDSTSVYSIGAIEANYTGRWFDFGDASREKTFLGMLFWSEEDTDNQVTVSYAENFSSVLGSETKDLSPSGSSLWDTALWDSGVWSTTGDRINTVKFTGFGTHLQPTFSDANVDTDFHIYGYNLQAISGDIKQ